jgi:hypothetical protein
MTGRLGTALASCGPARLARTTSTTRVGLIGLAVARIGLACIALLNYAVHFADRQYLWGPDGVWPWEVFVEQLDTDGSFSLYALSSSATVFDLLYLGGVLAALLFLLGVLPRVTALVHWAFLWSLYERNPSLLDGGDNLTYVLLPLFCLVESNRYLAIGAAERRERLAAALPSVAPTSVRRMLVTQLHNVAWLTMVGQIVVVYVLSGLYKAGGELWQNGSALYYAMRTDEFRWPGLSEHFYENALFVGTGTWFTVGFQLAFPFLLFSRTGRALAFTGAVLLHLQIAVFMGIVTFSLTMIFSEAVIVDDATYRRVAALSRGLRRTVRGRLGARGRGTPPRPATTEPETTHG